FLSPSYNEVDQYPVQVQVRPSSKNGAGVEYKYIEFQKSIVKIFENSRDSDFSKKLITKGLNI
ncbi:MAG TPA: hypothetical protein PKK23_18090, partial [Nitrospirales bacterium]|nr:hypothetical protein [Nitrospirales bacterium]